MYESVNFEYAFNKLCEEEDVSCKDICEVLERGLDEELQIEIIKLLCDFTGRDYEDFICYEDD